jgi:hypothetical protein
MSDQRFRRFLIAVTVGGVLILAALAVTQGPAVLTALAAVLGAGATLVASATNKKK